MIALRNRVRSRNIGQLFNGQSRNVGNVGRHERKHAGRHERRRPAEKAASSEIDWIDCVMATMTPSATGSNDYPPEYSNRERRIYGCE